MKRQQKDHSLLLCKHCQTVFVRSNKHGTSWHCPECKRDASDVDNLVHVEGPERVIGASTEYLRMMGFSV